MRRTGYRYNRRQLQEISSSSQEPKTLTPSHLRPSSNKEDKEETLDILRSVIEVSEKMKTVDVDTVESAFERLIKERDYLRTEKDKYMSEKAKQEAEMESIRLSMEKEKNSMLNEIKSLKKQKEEIIAENDLLHEELEKFDIETQSRYSQNIYGQSPAEGKESIRSRSIANKTQENADDLDIPSISDPNRPLRLAEKYWELFTNQWAEAKEEFKSSEQENVYILLETLRTCYRFCKDVADKQLEDIQCILKTPGHKIKSKARRLASSSNADVTNITDKTHANKLIRDCRKCFTEDASKQVVQQFMQNLPGQINYVNVAFVKKCTELSWFMVVQDPPMILGEEALAGAEFDSNIYREYDSTGVVVKYTVWLPLLLHENGPVLCKGVAKLNKSK